MLSADIEESYPRMVELLDVHKAAGKVQNGNLIEKERSEPLVTLREYS